MIRKLLIFLVIFSFANSTFALSESYKTQIITYIYSIPDYNQQLNKVEILAESLKSDKTSLAFLSELKNQIIYLNLEDYIKNNYSKKIIEDKYDFKKAYLLLKQKDVETSINPYFLEKLKAGIIKYKSREDSIYFKAYIYIYFDSKTGNINKNIENTSKIFKDKSNFTKTLYLEEKTIKNLDEIGLNYLSKKDLFNAYDYLINNHIGTDSEIFSDIIKYRNFLLSLNENKITLQKNITNQTQKYNLSCEVNSATLYANYFLNTSFSEDDLINHISTDESKIVRSGNKFIWGDPNEVFVGKIKGKQSKNVRYFTGYGVYANPISQVLQKVGVKNNISNFDKDKIIYELANNRPVIFWYINQNNKGIVDTKSFTWFTQNGKEIKAYVGEHTGLITGIDFDNYGNIGNIYYYEGKNLDLQKSSYNEIAYQASFFNMMIVGE